MPLTHKAAKVDADSPFIGQRIDRLVQQLCCLSRSQVFGLFDHGCVTRNGATMTDAGHRLAAGDRVELHYDAKQRRDVALIPKGGHWRDGRCANALLRARTTDLGEGGALYDERVRIVPLK